METLKSIIPEIIFVTGVAMVVIVMWSLMGWQYALFFTGAVLILVSAYVNELMSVSLDEEEEA